VCGEVRAITAQQIVEYILRERKLHWFGHMIKMDHQCIPQQALHWEVLGFMVGPGHPSKTGETQ